MTAGRYDDSERGESIFGESEKSLQTIWFCRLTSTSASKGKLALTFFHMSSSVSKCSQMFSKCFQMFSNVITCFHPMFPDVFNSFKCLEPFIAIQFLHNTFRFLSFINHWFMLFEQMLQYFQMSKRPPIRVDIRQSIHIRYFI